MKVEKSVKSYYIIDIIIVFLRSENNDFIMLNVANTQGVYFECALVRLGIIEGTHSQIWLAGRNARAIA